MTLEEVPLQPHTQAPSPLPRLLPHSPGSFPTPRGYELTVVITFLLFSDLLYDGWRDVVLVIALEGVQELHVS